MRMSPPLCAAVVLLATAAAFSEVVEVQPEVQEPILHKLHDDQQQDWQIHEAAAAAAPLVQQESDVYVSPLALPEQPRLRNQARRRRKRPRPAVYEAESLREDVSTAYHAYTTDSYDERAQRPRNRRRRPYPPPFSPSQTEDVHNNENYDTLRYPEASADHKEISQPEQQTTIVESDTELVFPKRHIHNHEQPEVFSDDSSEVITDGTSSKGMFLPPPRSYRKPYKSRIRQEEDDTTATVSPQDIKALLKKYSGSFSLSELLQEKNLTLADLLRGSRDAWNAIAGGTQLDTSLPRDPNPPTSRLPLQEHGSRHKNFQQQKTHRYSENVKQPEELPDTRRLPVFNPPSRRVPSTDSVKPVRRFNQDLRRGTGERVRFVPSNPRRRTTTTTSTSTTADNLHELSTESSDITNSITQNISEEDENEYVPLSPIFSHEKKTETEENALKAISTEAVPIHTASVTIYPTKETEVPNVSMIRRPPRISLKMQESPAIDPLHTIKAVAVKNEESAENRLRGKHMPHYTAVETVSSNTGSPVDSNKPDELISTKPRLPLLSLNSLGLNPILEDGSTTESALDTTTKEKVTLIVNSTTEVVQSREKNLSELKESSAIFSEPHIVPPVEFASAIYTTEPSNADKNSIKMKDEPMKKIIPLPTDSSDSVLPARATTAGDELLEFLKTETGASRLARILSLRNMSLAELIEHRERGSSQQHLAEIFKDTAPTHSTAPTKEMPNNSTFYSDSLNNHIMLDVLKSFKALDNEKDSKSANIPSIQEMFSMPEDLKHNNQKDSHIDSFNDENAPKETAPVPIISTNINKGSNESEADSEAAQSILLSLREPRIYEHISSFQSAPVKVSIKADQNTPIWYHQPPLYVNNPSTSYYISDERTTTPKEIDDSETILLLEDTGDVHEVTEITDNGIVESITNKYYNGIYRQTTDSAEVSEGRIPNVVKSAMIVSAVILGLAILGFLVIFVVCRWKQKRARRRFVDGIANIRAHSPILIQQEEKTNGQSLSPVLVNNRDFYQRELSEDEHMNDGARRYYLWRTIRKTLSYR